MYLFIKLRDLKCLKQITCQLIINLIYNASFVSVLLIDVSLLLLYLVKELGLFTFSGFGTIKMK